MNEYTCTVSVCDDGWHELCRIEVPGNASLFNAVHAVVAGHYDILHRGMIILTRDITPAGLGMSIDLLNHVRITDDSIIDYSPMSDNTDSDEDVI